MPTWTNVDKSATSTAEVDFEFSDATDFVFSDDADFVFVEASSSIAWVPVGKSS